MTIDISDDNMRNIPFGWDPGSNQSGTNSQRDSLRRVVAAITACDITRIYHGAIPAQDVLNTLHNRVNFIHIPICSPPVFWATMDLIDQLVRLGISRTRRDRTKIRCIYYITKAEGDYVGRSFDLIARLNQHHQRRFSCGGLAGITNLLRNTASAIIDNNVTIQILERLPTDDETFAREREQYWIDQLSPILNKRDELAGPFSSGNLAREDMP